jgi:hypothetical protein
MGWLQGVRNWLSGTKLRKSKSRGMLRNGRRLGLEPLESRELLSAAPYLQGIGIKPTGPKDASPLPLFVNGVRAAYGLGTYTSGVLSGGISFAGVPGDGRGQTIAIVDAYDDPYAAGDLNAFSAYFGLPTFNNGSGSPTFKQLTQTGQPVSTSSSSPNYVSTDPFGGWEVEEIMDIEWAHAIAPMANIYLYEASNDRNNLANLFTTVHTADNTPGVVAVSMSWDVDESSFTASQIANFDSTDFSTPAGHLGGSATIGGTQLAGGISYFAASGDNGAYGVNLAVNPSIGPEYPTSSSNVVSVGGTSLTVTGSNPNYGYGGETAWGSGLNSGFNGGSGGGISAVETLPTFQGSKVSKYSTTYRTFPDVAMNADPYTGVPVYDTFDTAVNLGVWSNGNGGTSLSTPMWAGLIAIVDEGRAIAGLGSLDGATQTLPALYNLPTADFHDVTSGSTGPAPTFIAATGYDLTTGLGSPVGNKLIPALVNYVPAVTGISPPSGSSGGGTTVTITGTNLSGGMIVHFGALLATNVTVVSSTQITAVSPAGTGTVDVTVTGPGGVSAISSADQFTYSNVPLVTSITPPAAPLAGGTTVTIIGSNFTGATAVTFGTTPATSFTIVSSTKITATVPAGTGTVDVTVTNSNGKSSTSSADQFTYEGKPTITGVTPANGALAGLTIVTITGTNLAGASLVKFGSVAGTIQTNTPTQIVVTSPAGTGTVDITVTDPGGTSATSSADKFTYVGPPTVATAASATPSPVNGLTTNLSVLGADVSGEGSLTYKWAATTVPTGATPPTYSSNGLNSSKNSTATFAQAGAYTFTVTITDGSGQTVTSSVNVTVNQTMTTIGVLPANKSIYEDQTQQFTATAYDQFGIAMATQPTFTWSKVSGVGSISTSGLFSSPSASGAATVAATSGTVQGTMGITVLSKSPTITTTASATPSPVTGTTTNLSVAATDEQGASTLTYSWAATVVPHGAAAPTFSANNSNAAQNSIATFTSAGNYTFTVTVTNSLSLTSTSVVSVTVNQTPTTIKVGPSTASVIVGAVQQFAATGYDQFGTLLASQPVYTWSATTGQITSAGLFTAPSTPTTSTVTAAIGAVQGNATVTVAPLPTINAAYVISDPLAPGKTALYIYGTGTSDTIMVNPATGAGVAPGSVTVLFNGVSKGTFAPTSRIIIHGVAGNETIGVSPQVTTPSFIYGGRGNDTLWGGGGANVIVGGAGANKLYGGLGRSILIAGASASLLSAGGGDALLIAGTTDYSANDAALMAILKEWSSSESYATRMADIMGPTKDPLAQNGAYYLNAATVHANGLVNHIATSGGLAAFFQSTHDIVTGKTASEITVAIK